MLKQVLPDRPELLSFQGPVSSVKIDVSKPVKNLELNVERSASKPDKIPRPDEEVNRYFEITANTSDNNIQKAEIGFSVSRRWINNRTVDPGGITLMRYSNGWQELETVQRGQNETHFRFTVHSPGFSTFAVAAEQVRQDNEVGRNVSQDGLEAEEQEDSTDSPEGSLLLPLYLIPAGLFVIAIVMAFHYRDEIRAFRKKRRTKAKIGEVTERLKEQARETQEIEDPGLLEEAERLFEREQYSQSLRKLQKLEDQMKTR